MVILRTVKRRLVVQSLICYTTIPVAGFAAADFDRKLFLQVATDMLTMLQRGWTATTAEACAWNAVGNTAMNEYKVSSARMERQFPDATLKADPAALDLVAAMRRAGAAVRVYCLAIGGGETEKAAGARWEYHEASEGATKLLRAYRDKINPPN